MTITVETSVHKDARAVWELWTKPEHICKWNFASNDWECPKAANDVRVGGTFSFTMAAKDKSFSFDFGGTYTAVEPGKLLEYTLGDGRKVSVRFESVGDNTRIIETFDAENINSEEMQRGGWQAILDNFKAYAEASK